jgi:hypothetical protein
MEKNKVLVNCPVCSGPLSVSELTCDQCGAKVVSRFEVCSVCRLPEDMYQFLMTFIKTRGSIKEMEKELGVSYPTVRGRMDELQRLLGFTPGGSAQSAKDVLDMLERGDISAEEAEEMLKQSGSGSVT